MNNFKNSMNKIKISKDEKEKILNNILNNKKKGFSINQIFFKIAVAVFVAFISVGGTYALIKVFKIDTKIQELYDLDDETVEQIDGTDINTKKEFDNLDINIIQTIATNNNIYVRLDITGKETIKHINTALLMRGTSIDKKNIEKIIYEDSNTTEYNIINQDIESSGVSLIEEKEELKTSSYLIEYSYANNINYGAYAMRIYTSDNKYYDMTFELKENTTNKKEYNIKKEIYNDNKLTITTNKITITSDSIIINYSVSDPKIFESSEIYGEYFTSYNYKDKENNTNRLYLFSNYIKQEDGTYNTIFGFKENFHNINTIKSININNVELKL